MELTKQALMEEELASYQSGKDGKQPQEHFYKPPASSLGVFVCYKRKAVPHDNDICFGLAVRDGILGKYQEVTEDHQVGHYQAGPRMLEVVAEVFGHPQTLQPLHAKSKEGICSIVLLDVALCYRLTRSITEH